MEFDLSGTYPLILEGETAGEVQVSREGLYWNFEASCSHREELLRLSVYGGGKEGYLGLMEPAGEGLRLSRRLSRGAVRDFPCPITHGGQRGGPQYITEAEAAQPKTEAGETPPAEETAEEKSEEADNYSGEFPLCYYSNAKKDKVNPLNENKPPTLPQSAPLNEAEGLLWTPCALPCSLFSGLMEKKLCSSISGAYLAREGDFLFLAAPEDCVRDFPKTASMHFEEEMTFSGKKYLVCKMERNDCGAGF